jgi:hypothetical protein
MALVHSITLLALLSCLSFGGDVASANPSDAAKQPGHCGSLFGAFGELGHGARDIKEGGLSSLLLKTVKSPISYYRRVFGSQNRNRTTFVKTAFGTQKKLEPARKDFFLEDIVVQSGHSILRKPEVIRAIVKDFRSQNLEGILKVQADDAKIEFYEIRDSRGDLLWVELRGGHHRAIALYIYLQTEGRPVTVGELDKVCSGICQWKSEHVQDSSQSETVPLAGTNLESYSGNIGHYESAKAPTFVANGNNRTRTDVTIGESAYATMLSQTSSQPVGFYTVSQAAIKQNGGLRALLDKAQAKTGESEMSEVVLFTQDAKLRAQIAALLADSSGYQSLNLYRASLAGEKSYIESIEHFEFKDLIPLRLQQIYQTSSVTELSL